MSLTKKIFLALLLGFILGISLSLINKDSSLYTFIDDYFISGLFSVVGSIFINFLKFMIVPIVFSSLIVGITKMSNISSVGKLGGKVVALFFVTTIFSVSVAIGLSYLFGIGKNFDELHLPETTGVSSNAQSFGSVITNMFPSNMLEPLVTNNMLQLIVVAVILGAAIIKIKDNESIINVFKKFEQISFTLVGIIMNLAPYGVFALITKVFAQQGYQMIIPILEYGATVIAGLLVLLLILQPTLVMLAGLNPLIFIKKCREIMMIAFSTSSSGATLPFTIHTATHRMGMSDKVAGFTIPFCSALNLNGTSIMIGCATIFIANIYHIPLSFLDIISIIALATVATLGTAGVPGAGMIMLTMVLAQHNIPLEGIALVLTIDRLLDMSRTVISVLDDLAICLLLAKKEKAVDTKVFNDLSI